jgi:glycosyltransferase involved in cell wall biosynthesis
MKVLLHTPDLKTQGGVTAFCATIKNSFKSEVDYFIAGPRDETEHRIYTPLRMLSDYVRYFWIMVSRHYDVIQVNPSFRIGALSRDAGFVLIAKAFHKKVIVFIHGWDKEFERKLRAKCLWLFRCTYFHADAFAVLARDFKGRLESMGYMGPIYVGRTAVDNTLLLSLRDDNSSRPHSHKPFNVLFLSRIIKEKGIMEALKGFGILRSKNPDVTMTVAGDGEGMEEAKKLIEERKIPDVRFVGYVSGEEKAKELSRAHCYLFPSYEEGMPISVLEAMAFGLPVITRPVGALADFFENGAMGYMTESKAPEVFAGLMQKLLDDPVACEQMGQYNRKYAKEHFSASSVAAQIESIYSDVLHMNREGAKKKQGEAVTKRDG